ncbi:MAG TPA: 16S rRNA (uracil(1498)-N(3))-methyltransferase [Nocardioides sp.]|uniref:16S rRNA (uracil(1498)-N(3))-methyltransferase n=1 Tax=Nocardioides sp. TaxID=35761 RepID=UPI002F403762
MTLPVHWVESLAGTRRGDRVEVDGDEAHHAVAVRRVRADERVVLTDGRGTTVTGTVSETGKRRMVVVAEEVDSHEPPTPSFTVVQALPKGDRGELAVEVLTEIGVETIVPWAASRSVAVWRGERAAKGVARWRSTAREAAKQSRRAWFPEVADLASTDEVMSLLATADLALVLHEDGDQPLPGAELPGTGTIVVVVGPEGGLTDEELATFRAAGAHVVRLGAEVLRTSTAGVAAVSALLARTPRWG